MKKKVIILIALCCLFIQAAQSDTLSITDLRTEQLTNPLGLDTSTAFQLAAPKRATQCDADNLPPVRCVLPGTSKQESGRRVGFRRGTL
mgnify:CR=1 FL=1